jgi:hypothetical protein
MRYAPAGEADCSPAHQHGERINMTIVYVACGRIL